MIKLQIEKIGDRAVRVTTTDGKQFVLTDLGRKGLVIERTDIIKDTVYRKLFVSIMGATNQKEVDPVSILGNELFLHYHKDFP